MFGMCVSIDDFDKKYVDYGIMLYIDNIDVLFDGCFIIYIIVGRRFCVVLWLIRNGYNIVKIEWMDDECFNLFIELYDFEMLNVDCYKVLKFWFSSLIFL